MTNREIAQAFRQLAQLMELHQDNPFKIRSYENAYLQLKKLDAPLSEMSAETIGQLPGIGAAITAKIEELLLSGSMEALEKYRQQTPPGVVEMLQINGFGPKKIRAIWKGLEVESIGELQYALNENRLVELKGFGEKTQAELQQKIAFFLKSSGQYHYRTLATVADDFLALAQQKLNNQRWEESGALRRKAITLTHIDLITTATASHLAEAELLEIDQQNELHTLGKYQDYPIRIQHCHLQNWGSKQFRFSGSEAFVKAFAAAFPTTDFKDIAEEEQLFEKAGLPYIAPELRENDRYLQSAHRPHLLEPKDIRGVVHCHTTYSDGIHSLEQMAQAAQEQGFGYMLITDHSQSAFYANGLKEDRLREQWAAIDALNEEMAPFRVLKGIESDILNDGSLDYSDEILAQFDLVIASIHSNLRMDEGKATERLISAIENPYTHILGHPTGRLLLSRKGYPIDHKKIIDACAANRVAIELNANPMRLDLDWTWLPYAIEKGVPICINPDAHAIGGIQDIRYGVYAARKGGLEKKHCLNCLEAEEFVAWFKG